MEKHFLHTEDDDKEQWEAQQQEFTTIVQEQEFDPSFVSAHQEQVCSEHSKTTNDNSLT